MNDYYMEPSDKKSKKWQITYLNKETGRVNTIYFGQKPYQDFTKKYEAYFKSPLFLVIILKLTIPFI